MTFRSNTDVFAFRVVGSIKGLDALIRGTEGEGATARLSIGSCWPWAYPDAAGELDPRVSVGDRPSPWNGKS